MASEEIKRSMERSNRFAEISLPLLREVWPDCRITPTEYQDHPSCRLLDATAGIDYLVERKGLVYGLAFRGQKASYPFSSFTIREWRVDGATGLVTPSELPKTLAAIESGAITAAFQMQAYVDEESGICHRWALAHRVKLLEWMRDHPELVHENSANDPGRGQEQRFRWISFSDCDQQSVILCGSYDYKPSRPRQLSLTIEHEEFGEIPF